MAGDAGEGEPVESVGMFEEELGAAAMEEATKEDEDERLGVETEGDTCIVAGAPGDKTGAKGSETLSTSMVESGTVLVRLLREVFGCLEPESESSDERTFSVGSRPRGCLGGWTLRANWPRPGAFPDII